MIIQNHIEKFVQLSFMTSQNTRVVRSGEWFAENRKEQYNYVSNIMRPRINDNSEKFLHIVKAPVKSGKKDLVLIAKCLLDDYHHVFISAFHRKADKCQREELTSYGIDVYSGTSLKEFTASVEKIVNIGKKCLVHLDELDYGAGFNQRLEEHAYKSIVEHHIHTFLYSATPDVAIKVDAESSVPKDVLPSFIPSKLYYGVSNFLKDGRFHEAEPFFEISNVSDFRLSEQGEKLMKEHMDPPIVTGSIVRITKIDSNGCEHDYKGEVVDIDGAILSLKHKNGYIEKIDKFEPNVMEIKVLKKHIAVIRTVGNSTLKKLDHKSRVTNFQVLKTYLPDYLHSHYPGVEVRFVGCHDEIIKWSNPATWNTDNDPSKKYIIVINNTAGRSTEWTCQPFMTWYHCFRTPRTPASTQTQDQERPCHYGYNKSTLHIYGCKTTAKYSAGIITTKQYVELLGGERPIDGRLKKSKKSLPSIHVKTEVYEKWVDIPKELNFRKMSHLKREYVLSSDSTNSPALWEKYKHLKGFRTTNFRSSRKRFKEGKKKALPIYFRSDVMKDLKEGLDNKSTQRLNVFYEDGETDPDKYKFMVRKFSGKEATQSLEKFDNNSMYSRAK